MEMEEADLEDETWEDVCIDLGVNVSIMDNYRLTVSCIPLFFCYPRVFTDSVGRLDMELLKYVE